MVAWIDDIVARLGLNAEIAYALHLCLEEAVVNVISYAFAPGTFHYVHVAIWRDDEAMHAEVTDDGYAFDPLSHELPTAPQDLASTQVGGLGIKLMRSFAGRVAYQREGSTNRLTLSFPVG